MKVYIVNYKETTLGEDNVLGVECGTCDYGYLNENEAIVKASELSVEKENECVEELGYDREDVSVVAEKDYFCVTAGSNTYEYGVMLVEVM